MHVGHAAKLQTNARNLSWDRFTSADILVGTVVEAARSSTLGGSDQLSAHEVDIDFGEHLGPQRAQAILSNRVFSSAIQLLSMQLLAVTNLADDEDVHASCGDTSARIAVLTVGGLAVLQPANYVANGCKLA